ncbi:hypothetical protein NX059_001011 [Plenodomus lindquistii]|nr:hypothetical protein NX059_001011 [Plenodomus lindquistii]
MATSKACPSNRRETTPEDARTATTPASCGSRSLGRGTPQPAQAANHDERAILCALVAAAVWPPPPSAMINPLADYLSALEARDAREQAHAQYVNAYTKLADRTAASAGGARNTAAPPAGMSSPASDAQLRSELAATQRTRGELEAKLRALSAEVSILKASDAQQKQRIEQLERAKTALERRGKDRADELKGKGRFVEEVQDEMVALNLQLNMAEQERERLKKENDELTRRWMHKMEDEARKMNDRMGWDEARPNKGGSRR